MLKWSYGAEQRKPVKKERKKKHAQLKIKQIFLFGIWLFSNWLETKRKRNGEKKRDYSILEWTNKKKKKKKKKKDKIKSRSMWKKKQFFSNRNKEFFSFF